jgi:hypothetical protein
MFPGPQLPGAHCQLASEVRFSASRKRSGLLMPRANPADLVALANCIRDSVERVADNAVDSPDTCFSKNIHQQVRHFFRHAATFLWLWPYLAE